MFWHNNNKAEEMRWSKSKQSFSQWLELKNTNLVYRNFLSKYIYIYIYLKVCQFTDPV